MSIFDTLGSIINTAYILYCFALGIWAGFVALRSGTLGGQFWGAMWSGSILATFGLIVWILRSLTGEQLRWVYILYILYFIIVLPGTFALLRGRDDRLAATVFCGVAIFSALAAISAGDPSRHVIASPTPAAGAPIVTVTPTQQ